MIEDAEMSPARRGKYPVFDIIPQISAKYGGEVSILSEQELEADAQNDPILRQKLLDKVVPTVDTIVRLVQMKHFI